VVRHARVQAESHIRTPENADYVVASGQADMVSIVRGQIADPHLAAKARDGRPDDIRPCLSCNQMCWGRRFRDYWISCLINPSAGREFEWGGDRFTLAARPKRVLVVGGGVAGLEAARVAAERGHQVTLVEASPRLGGQFRLAGMQPRRAQILDFLDWYERQLNRLQVAVRLNTLFDADDIAAFGADEVILAPGSQPAGTGFQRALPQFPALPGIERGNVWSAAEAMQKSARLGRRVMVLDEGANGKTSGTALFIAEQSCEVILVTPATAAMAEMARTNADVQLRMRLRALGARLMTDSAIREWHGNGATVFAYGAPDERVEADSLVLSCTNIADTTLADALAGSSLAISVIGDAVAPRTAVMAIYEGRKRGMAI